MFILFVQCSPFLTDLVCFVRCHGVKCVCYPSELSLEGKNNGLSTLKKFSRRYEFVNRINDRFSRKKS